MLADEGRASRFLALTGLTPDTLRASLAEPATLAAVFDFLGAHEPDLVAAAESLGVAPSAFLDAGARLGR